GEGDEGGVAGGPGDGGGRWGGAPEAAGGRRQRDRAVGAGPDGERRDLLGRRRLGGGEDREHLVRVGGAADADHARAAGQLVGDGARREVRAGQRARVEDDLQLAHVAALHLDGAYAGHARERRPERERGGLAQDARVDVALDVESDDGQRRRRDPLDAQVGVGG